ncbi:MAG: DUF58 domain-containing protein [Candidatus Aenigmarchaeota archaeon]|nr:DUF58 domain-containing protein [Candidatus Aenigmarchaeota archaeon]
MIIEKAVLTRKIDAEVKRIIDTFRTAVKYMILFRGKGIEFAGLREYVPGEDDASRIDWRASLRSQSLYVREYEEERDLDIFILLDTSSSMLFGSQGMTKSEYASVIAGVLSYAGIDSGDNVGFAMFNRSVPIFLEPVNDVYQYYKILDLLTNESMYGSGANLKLALDRVTTYLGPRTFLFIISDFLGLGKGWETSLKMASHKFDKVLGIMVRDLRDLEPPAAGYMRFYDPFTGRAAAVKTDKVRKRYAKYAKEQYDQVLAAFRSSNAEMLNVLTTESFAKQITRYFERFSMV